MAKVYKSKFHEHDKDKLLKHCPFCGGKAKLRSPTKLRANRSAICSDVICTKCGADKASWPWSRTDYNDHKELPRDVQDADVIKQWNKRSRRK